MSRGRSTIRLRLTLLYAGAFFLAGAILVALNYFYVQQSLDRRPAGAESVVQEFLNQRGVHRPPLLDSLFSAVRAQAAHDRDETLKGMLVWSLVSLGAIGIAAGGFGWLLAERALRPLQNVTATARRVAERNLHERIGLIGPDDEIKELADTFDAMLERLDRAFDGQRRFVANASHELRTPLAINRTLVEVALGDPDVSQETRRLGEGLLQVNRRNENLIDGLLVLASSEQRLEVRARVDLAEVTGRAIMSAQSEADSRRIRIESNLQSGYVTGDPALLERLAHNLIDNAVRYNTGSGLGWIRVAVAAERDYVWLGVENTGPIVATSDLDVIFEPFRRLPSHERITDTGTTPGARGAGLGLSIVRSVAIAHGGGVSAAARPEGGLIITVTLPWAPAGGAAGPRALRLR